MASSLVDALTEPFDPSKYHDNYREALLEVINNKAEGRKVVSPETTPTEQMPDLMAALRASVAAARKPGAAKNATHARSAKTAKSTKSAKPARRHKAA